MAGTGPTNTICNVVEALVDPTLVDNTPRLLNLLDKAERVHELLNWRDERGYTLVHLAAERNQPESLKCLLIKEGKPTTVDLSTCDMHTHRFWSLCASYLPHELVCTCQQGRR